MFYKCSEFRKEPIWKSSPDEPAKTIEVDWHTMEFIESVESEENAEYLLSQLPENLKFMFNTHDCKRFLVARKKQGIEHCDATDPTNSFAQQTASPIAICFWFKK